MAQKRILLFGSTGSIGESTLQVVDEHSDELTVVALAAHKNWQKLLKQVRRYRPRCVALSDAPAAEKLRRTLSTDSSTDENTGRAPPRVYSGAEGLVELVRETEGDVVVGAISGAAGLPSNLAALETGKDLALANKESLVMSGELLMRAARDRGRTILPVDSEHSAIFQSMLAGQRNEVESIILTASGGPFRETPAEKLAEVTKAEALNHPTWDMGAKITIDSATLMNKALEIIEARWLFDLAPEKIRVVVHPQSIIHSIVEFHDGSMISQLGSPDMRIPIQYALTYPNRLPLNVERVELSKVGSLTFFEPDPIRFPAIRLAYEVLHEGGTAATVFNAANEVAVAAFLAEEIPFTEILGCVERTLSSHPTQANATLEQILAADSSARTEAERQLQLSRANL